MLNPIFQIAEIAQNHGAEVKTSLNSVEILTEDTFADLMFSDLYLIISKVDTPFEGADVFKLESCGNFKNGHIFYDFASIDFIIESLPGVFNLFQDWKNENVK